MYLNRSRADALRSSFAFLVRGTIARHIRGEMKETMTLLKAKMEALYRDERSRTEFRAMPLLGNPYSLGGLNCAQRMPFFIVTGIAFFVYREYKSSDRCGPN
jgi:hypothetical protein